MESGKHEELITKKGIYSALVRAQEIKKGDEEHTVDGVVLFRIFSDVEPSAFERGTVEEDVHDAVEKDMKILRFSMTSRAGSAVDWEPDRWLFKIKALKLQHSC